MKRKAKSVERLVPGSGPYSVDELVEVVRLEMRASESTSAYKEVCARHREQLPTLFLPCLLPY